VLQKIGRKIIGEMHIVLIKLKRKGEEVRVPRKKDTKKRLSGEGSKAGILSCRVKGWGGEGKRTFHYHSSCESSTGGNGRKA